ncbi:MAG TPA: ATP-binding domain-containing protein [Polyangia bacterium]|jgi:DNA helicase-2/ATP-dependent DNA helicase PcrA
MRRPPDQRSEPAAGGAAEEAMPVTTDDVPAIPAEEEKLLDRVRASLAEALTRRPVSPKRTAASGTMLAGRRADDELVALRDEIGEARLEDVPQLVAQMERLQGVALTRADLQTILVDPASPYFGHLRLRETVAGRGVVERDVLIGRATYVDPKTRVNVVDWRHAPISQLYYRYEEGGDYEERFGERDVEGEIVARRTVTIEQGSLLRVACPQGVWAKRRAPGSDGQVTWERTDLPWHELSGGELSAARPGSSPRARRGVLGAAPEGAQRLDRHLPEIAALIDPRQFELITAKHSGVIVIQGGAGSGKTTIGLHRLAYLAYTFPERFPARRMLVVTYGAGLAAYIGQVLPSLGIEGVRVLTFSDWAQKELRRAVPWLRPTFVDDASPATTRVKSHPALLHELERRAELHKGKKNSHGAVELWAELLTDRPRLFELLKNAAEMPLSEADINEAHRIMVVRVAAVVARDPRERPPENKAEARARKRVARGQKASAATDVADPNASPGHWASIGLSEKPIQQKPEIDLLPEGIRRVESERDDYDDEDVRGETGIDGLRTEDDQPFLDMDDVAILLRAHQLLRGVDQPLAHLFVDEAQDLSPMKLSVLIGRTAHSTGGGNKRSAVPSITLAGDTSQRLFLDNGFGDWRGVLGHLGLNHVAIEPLRIAYRSTREILALARHAMGPLADAVPPEAKRAGAPIEAFRFSETGAAVAFLADALRDLAAREPRATVALLARHGEQADRYFDGLRRAEVPALRRITAQEFTFRPGVDVTDTRQVKGLEFDYVIMLDVNASSFGSDDEARHLFHIGVTRAAHQLWVIVTGTPSPLLPPELLRD